MFGLGSLHAFGRILGVLLLEGGQGDGGDDEAEDEYVHVNS